MMKLRILHVFVILMLLNACSKNGEEEIDLEAELDLAISQLNLEPLPEVQFPASNPYSHEKDTLGFLLFWDPILSGEKDIACVSCHHPDFAFGDGLDLSIGVRGHGLGPDRIEGEGIDRVPRNAQTILNVAYNGLNSTTQMYEPEEAVMFWDGREVSLEEQAKLPPTSRSEMRGDFKGGAFALEYIIPRLKDYPEYVSLFEKAFPGENDPINVANYSKAMAVYERTLVTDNSPYDQYLRGNKSSLSIEQKEGLILFFGKGGCGECHSGPMLSNWEFHALGVAEHPQRLEEKGGPDVGNEDFEDYKFRTPSLRNVSLTGPYMHNGILATLKEVLIFENEGQSRNEYVPEISSDFKPKGLSDAEMDKIVAFLHALTDTDFDKKIPESVPSGLKVGGEID
jgi:cytochrome c peroxidase